MAEAALRGQDPVAFSDPFLFTEALDEESRWAWGRIHPLNMGGEFVPDLEPDEVEIARIERAFVTGDAFSLRVRRREGGARYQMVDEYRMDAILLEAPSQEPLTMGEVSRLIDDTGVIERLLQMNFGGAPEEARGFVTVSSTFYPGLTERYREWVEAWIDRRRAG